MPRRRKPRESASRQKGFRATSCASGRFGMVFQVEVLAGRGQLRYIAFGVRHHPRESNAETVYEVAHRCLRG